MTDEEVDKFKPSRSAIKLGERAAVGSTTGVDTGLTIRKEPNYPIYMKFQFTSLKATF